MAGRGNCIAKQYWTNKSWINYWKGNDQNHKKKGERRKREIQIILIAYLNGIEKGVWLKTPGRLVLSEQERAKVGETERGVGLSPSMI